VWLGLPASPRDAIASTRSRINVAARRTRSGIRSLWRGSTVLGPCSMQSGGAKHGSRWEDLMRAMSKGGGGGQVGPQLHRDAVGDLHVRDAPATEMGELESMQGDRPTGREDERGTTTI
jgi:hypothetical protein